MDLYRDEHDEQEKWIGHEWLTELVRGSTFRDITGRVSRGGEKSLAATESSRRIAYTYIYLYVTVPVPQFVVRYVVSPLSQVSVTLS